MQIVTGITGGETSKEIIDSRNINALSMSKKVINTASRRCHPRNIQNFRLVLLKNTTDEINNVDLINSITKLRQIGNVMEIFIEIDDCIDFITDIENEQVFMICAATLDRTIYSILHDIVQITSIYILRQQDECHDSWTREWSKLKGMFVDKASIYDEIKLAAQQCDQNAVSLSFVKTADTSTNKNLDKLDQTFMYTLLLKEILLTIDFEQKCFDDFIKYCREELSISNSIDIKIVDKFEKEYHHHNPIWWYTYPCFLYSMINRALRTMEIDLIVKMGFFVRDLHMDITKLHNERYNGQNRLNAFIVYRGQGLIRTDFEKLQETQGGLMSFNNFLSTSVDRDISYMFADSNQYNPGFVGVLFKITIDPSKSTTAFANIHNISAYQTEEEILFSMHSVFRIEEIVQIHEDNDRLWQVDLTLTNDDDPQLRDLTESIRQETYPSAKGWYRLGNLLMQLGLFDKARQIFDIMLDNTNSDYEKALVYHIFGMINSGEGNFTKAIESYGRSVDIYQKILSPSDPQFAVSCGGLGIAYINLGEYSKALLCHEKALEISEKTLPSDHPASATPYNNIATTLFAMGEYSKALSFSEKALQIEQKTLPSNHPKLAGSHNNIGTIYNKMGNYLKALSHHEKALHIMVETLPPNHPDLASTYNNIGGEYNSIGKYPEALLHYEKALEIAQKLLSLDHPGIAITHNNIGLVCDRMGEYSEALSQYKKALEIWEKTLPSNHPNFAVVYNNIGSVCDKNGDPINALLYYEKSLEIKQKTFLSDHPDLAISYSNIASAFDNMCEYSKALSYHEKALEIWKQTLPSSHPYFADTYTNIAAIFDKMGNHSKAALYRKKAFHVALDTNDPELKEYLERIGALLATMDQSVTALSNLPHTLADIVNLLNQVYADDGSTNTENYQE